MLGRSRSEDWSPRLASIERKLDILLGVQIVKEGNSDYITQRKIIKARKALGLTLREAGELVGASQQTVWTWENKSIPANSEMFAEYCTKILVPR